MDIANLKRIIKANIIDQPSGRKTLTVTGELLESNTLTNLFTDYLERQPLVIEMTEPLAETANSIIVSGSSPNEIFSQMLVSAQFSVVGNEAALVLTAQPNTQWTFASSFPALAKTVFSRLKFKEATLHLVSHQVDSDTPLGLSFTGALQLNGLLSHFAWLLGGESQITVSGLIDWESNYPLIQLGSRPRQEKIELGFFRLPAPKFELLSTVIEDGDTQSSSFDAVATISSSIDFETQNGTVSIPLRADSYLNSPWVQLSTELEDALETGLDSLSTLANGLDLSSIIPQQLPIQDRIGLSGLVLQVDLAKRKLESVIIGVESKQPWVLLEDLITIDYLSLSFRLDEPMSAKKLSMMFLGEFGIGTGT